MVTAENKLKYQPIHKLVLSYMLTTLIALALNSVYNLTDSLFVSWGVNINASGAISVVLPFVLLQSAISTTLGGGAAAIVSIKLGEGKIKDAGEITLNAMIAFYATAILVSVFGLIFMDNVLNLMGITQDLYDYAKEYFIIILLGNVFSTGFSSIIRAEGKMLYGLLIWVIPISINIALDAVFILALGWGIKGAALATVICQFTSFLMMVLFFIKFSKLDFKKTKIRFKRILEIIQMGLPSLIQIGSLSLITLIINNILAKVSGTLGVNTFAFVNKLVAFAIVPFTALTQAIMPIIGFNHGANQPSRVSKTIKFSIIIALVYSVIALIISETIPSYLMRIFTKEQDVIDAGTNALRILAPALIFIPLPLLMGASFQALGKKGLALLLYSLNLIFLLPFIFTLYLKLQIIGVWLSYVLSTICSALTALIITVFSFKNKKKINIAQ